MIEITYRGLLWSHNPDVKITIAYCAAFYNNQWARYPLLNSTKYGIDVDDLHLYARSAWRRALGYRLDTDRSVDGTPWEINDIEDEGAYEAALAAWQREQ